METMRDVCEYLMARGFIRHKYVEDGVPHVMLIDGCTRVSVPDVEGATHAKLFLPWHRGATLTLRELRQWVYLKFKPR